MIERLIIELGNAGFDVTAEEIADLLWLAAQVDPGPASISEARSPEAGRRSVSPPENLRLAEAKKTLTLKNLPWLPRFTYRVTVADEVPSGTLQRATSAYIPGGSALPGALELCRALRPLQRRVAARYAEEIDEFATAHRIAEARLWLPVLRPARERWLSLALVVDSSPSMGLWRPTVDELKRLLQTHGAFRDVRIWALDTGRKDCPNLVARPGGQVRSHQELLDPTGRQLILVVSDCVGPAWYGAALKDLLQGWSRRQPMGVLALLPQRLWRRTGLVNASIVQVRPGMAFETAPHRLASLPAAGADATDRLVGIPITSLEPDSETRKPELFAAWARLVAGVAGSQAPAMLLFPDDDVGRAVAAKRVRAPENHRKLRPEDRLVSFRTTASPLAYRLACLLSTVPLSLPIMRLVQHVLLPESRQSHLAEVVLGGLLRRVDPTLSDSDPDRVRYDFYPGVRELLRDGVDVADAAWVRHLLSRYVTSRFGRVASFAALVADSDGEVAIPREEEPFAAFYDPVLDRLPQIRLQKRPGLSEEYDPWKGCYLCLSCWRIVPLLAAHYQCPQCQADPDAFSRLKPVKKLKRSFWRWLIGAPPPIRCEAHAEAPLRLHCECGAVLTQRMKIKNDRPVGVGLVGSHASGKTTLLVTMLDYINRSETHLAVRGIGDTEKRFGEIVQRLLSERRPLEAISRNKDNHYAWEIFVRERLWQVPIAHLLAIHDAPGETWAMLNEKDSDRLDRYLSHLGSLVLIIDGVRVAADLQIGPEETWSQFSDSMSHGAFDRMLLRQLIERLDRETARRIRLALVVSKLDLLWDDERYRTLKPAPNGANIQGGEREELVRDMIIRSGRREVLLAGEKFFANEDDVRCFAVSSFGYRPTASKDGGELRLDQPIRPDGVAELLRWLLDLRETD